VRFFLINKSQREKKRVTIQAQFFSDIFRYVGIERQKIMLPFFFKHEIPSFVMIFLVVQNASR